eukprot:scaffold340967_cov30-Prasinocladus_malaysianus.AAC.1
MVQSMYRGESACEFGNYAFSRGSALRPVYGLRRSSALRSGGSKTANWKRECFPHGSQVLSGLLSQPASADAGGDFAALCIRAIFLNCTDGNGNEINAWGFYALECFGRWCTLRSRIASVLRGLSGPWAM